MAAERSPSLARDNNNWVICGRQLGAHLYRIGPQVGLFLKLTVQALDPEADFKSVNYILRGERGQQHAQ
jgi:hypothetical protein